MKTNIRNLIREAFKVRGSKYLIVSKDGKAHWSLEPSLWSACVSVDNSKLVESWIIEHRGVDRKRAPPQAFEVQRVTCGHRKFRDLHRATVQDFGTDIADSYTARARIPAPSIGGRNSLRPLG